MKNLSRIATFTATIFLLFIESALPAFADINAALGTQESTGVLDSYARVLPLEGGSNFRDLGGYRTEDGRTVRRGLLFRSGVMTGLTDKDQTYLEQIGFDTIVDLRSREELELFPNRWAANAGLNYLHHDYSFLSTATRDEKTGEIHFDFRDFYRTMPYHLKPQLKMYFDQALAGDAPLVVNCSAGQDRTGIASALMLTALGVPRRYVVYDYVLSTHFRRPEIERGDIDLSTRADTNAFAKMMLRHSDGETPRAEPLITDEGIPYIYYTFEQIEADHGSVLAFLDKELGVGASDIEQLKTRYLQ